MEFCLVHAFIIVVKLSKTSGNETNEQSTKRSWSPTTLLLYFYRVSEVWVASFGLHMKLNETRNIAAHVLLLQMNAAKSSTYRKSPAAARD